MALVTYGGGLWARSDVSFTGGITRRSLFGRVERLEKRHQRSRLRGTQVVSVGWHVATALDHLADELILRELDSDSIKIRTSFSSRPTQRVAVVALFRLENERPLPLQGCTPFQVLRRNRCATPGVHHWTPPRIDRP